MTCEEISNIYNDIIDLINQKLGIYYEYTNSINFDIADVKALSDIDVKIKELRRKV
ncbi:hypothetical protein LCGC14_1263370 [marine sediment metagenome]|uniref:Uncharacterized protein n=1 Tax=marine sediment metagenome TaxID=412755 RepID=A0A0F9LLD6_9ZZZZ